MLELLLEYGLFFAKVITIVIAILIITGGIFMQMSRGKSASKESHIEVTKLNTKYEEMTEALESHTLSKAELKKHHKTQKAKIKALEKSDEKRDSIFVLNFDGDIKASAVTTLREEITAILTCAKHSDEVFVHLESGGGMVHAYGLASSQLQRITDKKIPLTISVDKVAASGGYMMACVADRIIAAPFAILGSIGVVAQIPNFNRVLKKYDIDYEMITAGEYKRTLTLLGENTDKARAKFKEDIEDTHELFKDFITENRTIVNIEKVATGEHWFGRRAIELKLVDELKTSDDYLLEQSKTKDLYEVTYKTKKPVLSKLTSAFGKILNRSPLANQTVQNPIHYT
ncbi:MAG: protease SohB [Gammaproteobacteria bacterium]|nr:protease SohB [Gammaproteobacteria bacterium]